jgi:CheY-like chemotaxis protein
VGSVLLCDDAVAFGVLFQRWLHSWGVEDVAQAKTAERALALAEELQPDLIVLDHLLADATSEELVPQLRAAAPRSKVLLISGMSADRLAEKARAVGADGHVTKASATDDVRDAILALLP